MDIKSFVFRALPLSRDSRTERYLGVLDNPELNTWEDEYISSNGLGRLKLGRKKHKNIYSYPLYLLYLFLFSFFKLKRSDVVVCMDLDTYIPVRLASPFNKNIYLDIVDPIGQTRYRNIPFNKVFDLLEFLIIKVNARKVILPAIYRVDYYEAKLGVSLTSERRLVNIFENVVRFSDGVIDSNNESPLKSIGYFGSLDKTRGIKELISFGNKYGYRIIIAGRGELTNEIESQIESGANIEFYGEYNSGDLAFLYSKVDFCWAYYSPSLELHKYAAPNKYYEHLAFKTPIIFNEIVPFCSEVMKFNSGVVISNSLNEVALDELNCVLSEYDYKVENFDEWGRKYSEYTFKLIYDFK